MEVRAGSAEDASRAAACLEVALGHRELLHSRLTQRDRLAEERGRMQAVIASGRRVQFQVNPRVMGLVIGNKGAHIRQVRAECAVDRIVIDRESCVVRIVGDDPAEVARAKTLLAFDIATIPMSEQRHRASIVGKGGKTVTDIRARSGVFSIEVDNDHGCVHITGTQATITAAIALMESLVHTCDQLDAYDREYDAMVEEMHGEALKWGDEPAYAGGAYQYGRRAGRGAGGQAPEQPPGYGGVKPRARHQQQNGAQVAVQPQMRHLPQQQPSAPATSAKANGGGKAQRQQNGAAAKPTTKLLSAQQQGGKRTKGKAGKSNGSSGEPHSSKTQPLKQGKGKDGVNGVATNGNGKVASVKGKDGVAASAPKPSEAKPNGGAITAPVLGATAKPQRRSRRQANKAAGKELESLNRK